MTSLYVASEQHQRPQQVAKLSLPHSGQELGRSIALFFMHWLNQKNKERS